MKRKSDDGFEIMERYIDTVENIHASDSLKRKVMNVAYSGEQSEKKHIVNYAVRKWGIAVLLVLALSLCFHNEIMALAKEVFHKRVVYNHILSIGGKEVVGDMGYVNMNNLPEEAFNCQYGSLAEIEQITGISFLRSEKEYISPFPNVIFEKVYHANARCVSYNIRDRHYFVNNKEPEDSNVWRDTGDDAYSISYEAFIWNELIADQKDVLSGTYDGAVFIEEYVTAGGYTAHIFVYGNEYNAVIFDNNIEYTFAAAGLGTINKLGSFKKFLDTLK